MYTYIHSYTHTHTHTHTHTCVYVGARDGTFGWSTALQAGSSRFRFPMVSLKFIIGIILPVALWPWGRFSL